MDDNLLIDIDCFGTLRRYQEGIEQYQKPVI